MMWPPDMRGGYGVADASFPVAGKGQAWARATWRRGRIIVPGIWFFALRRAAGATAMGDVRAMMSLIVY
ncbi:hypothetical protein [Novacetimonas pomaceti]|nr:hypothetical protein [Novacetimonas pomaceti]